MHNRGTRRGVFRNNNQNALFRERSGNIVHNSFDLVVPAVPDQDLGWLNFWFTATLPMRQESFVWARCTARWADKSAGIQLLLQSCDPLKDQEIGRASCR